MIDLLLVQVFLAFGFWLGARWWRSGVVTDAELCALRQEGRPTAWLRRLEALDRRVGPPGRAIPSRTREAGTIDPSWPAPERVAHSSVDCSRSPASGCPPATRRLLGNAT